METNNGIVVVLHSDITTDQIDAFASLVSAGIDAWRKAGELLVSMMDADPLAMKKIIRKHPRLSMDVLVAFERIGRKSIYPDLLLDASPGSKRLLSFPYAMQERLYSEKVQVLIQWHPTAPRFIEKTVQSLTHLETEQVFGQGVVRTLEQQRDFLAAKQKPKSRPVNRLSAGYVRRERTEEPSSLGYFKVVIQDGKPELVSVTGDFPYAMPIELVSGDESEPFELFR